MDLLTLIVKDIIQEARDTITILLERADGRPLEYQAGQFLTFLFHFQGREVRRSYSFSSAPGVDPIASITVKRVVNGEVSRYLLDHLKVGDSLMSLPPAGRFLLEEEEKRGNNMGREQLLFFIAAGSGMVPVFSLIKKALAENTERRVVLITQHTDENSILFRKPLEAMLDRKGFRWISLLSRQGGRINNWLLEELLGKILLEEDPASPKAFYLCGPAAFMRMAQFTLRLMGLADTQIKKENFTVEYVPPPPLLTDTTPKKIMVRTGGKLIGGQDIIRFEAAWPKTILQAALDNHIQLPYSCKGGRCSTCTARCLSGKVKMSINEVLTEKDLQEGLVLTCVGYAETDVELGF